MNQVCVLYASSKHVESMTQYGAIWPFLNGSLTSVALLKYYLIREASYNYLDIVH